MIDKKIILIVDDSVSNLKNAEEVLKDKYSLALVKSGRQALDYLSHNTPDLVLLDVIMPEMDGFETITKMKENPATSKIPVIFLTVDSNVETELQGFKLGALDFINKPFVPEIMIYRIEAILELDSLRKQLEAEVRKKTRQLETSALQVVSCVADIVDNKSIYTKGHSTRVAGYAEEIARRLGLSDKEIFDIYYTSLLHDIGRLIVQDESFNQLENETADEDREAIGRHCEAGADLLKEFTIVNNIEYGARYHHDRYDGKGNLSGLSGEQIPLVARIICVANAYDNMNSFRSYRKPLPSNAIISFLEKEKGGMFDPEIADIMLNMVSEQYELKSFLGSYQNEMAQFGNAILHKVISEYTDEIKIEAQRDALTGLWDRKYTESAVNEYLERESNDGVMFMLDMDNFKNINDRYGHIKGDEVLIKFAEIIRTCCEKNDIICRIGGDEFIIFSKGKTSAINSGAKADNIIKTLRENAFLSIFDFSVSIGIVVAPNDGRTFIDLYNNADKALYYVKQNGKGGYHFYSDIESISRDSSATLADLEFIKNMFEDRDNAKNAMPADYGNFKNIYKFIERCISRTQQDVELVLLTLTDLKGEMPDVLTLKKANEVLSKAVCENVRRGDVFTSFSSSQCVVILVNVNEHFGNIVAERIKTQFYLAKGELPVELKCDLQPITVK